MKISWIELAVLAASGVPISADNVRSLHAQGIRAVLSLTEQPLTSFREITPALLAELDITAHHVPVPDQFPPTLAQAATIIAIMDDMAAAGRPLLVHCHAGIGRTGTALHLRYLAQGLTLAEARARVRLRRSPCTLISDAQEAFLHEFIAARAQH